MKVTENERQPGEVRLLSPLLRALSLHSFLSISIYLGGGVFPATCRRVYVSTCLCAYLSVCPSVYLSICPSGRLSLTLSRSLSLSLLPSLPPFLPPLLARSLSLPPSSSSFFSLSLSLSLALPYPACQAPQQTKLVGSNDCSDCWARRRPNKDSVGN